MSTVTKKDLIDRIAERSGCKRVDVKKVVQCLLEEITEDLASGHRLEFRDFGVFETKDRAARVAQNPKTMQRVIVPRKRTVKFKVGRLLKQRLDEVAGSANEHGGAAVEAAPPGQVVVVTKSPDQIDPSGASRGANGADTPR